MRRNCCAGCGMFRASRTRASSSRSTVPGFNVDVDRTRAQYAGVTARDVTNSMVVNLAGSSQVAPTYFLNPENGVSYSIVMQTPQYQMDSLNALKNLPISAPGASAQTLGAIADINRVARSAVVSQYNIQAMVQIYAHHAGARSRRGRGRRAEGRGRDGRAACRAARRSICSARCAR